MTNTEYRLKYPIGTKIKFIVSERTCVNAKKDNNKTGKIVSYMLDLVGIYLPGSDNNNNGCDTTTWLTSRNNIQILPQKNQQLLFSFMD